MKEHTRFLSLMQLSFSWQMPAGGCQQRHVSCLSHSLRLNLKQSGVSVAPDGQVWVLIHPYRCIRASSHTYRCKCVSKVTGFFVLCCLLVLPLSDHGCNYKLVRWSVVLWKPIHCNLLLRFSPSRSQVEKCFSRVFCCKCRVAILLKFGATLGFRFSNRVMDILGDQLFELIRLFELPEEQILQ